MWKYTGGGIVVFLAPPKLFQQRATSSDLGLASTANSGALGLEVG